MSIPLGTSKPQTLSLSDLRAQRQVNPLLLVPPVCNAMRQAWSEGGRGMNSIPGNKAPSLPEGDRLGGSESSLDAVRGLRLSGCIWGMMALEATRVFLHNWEGA